MMVFGAYMLINIWQNNQFCGSSGLENQSLCYEVRDPYDLAVVAAAITGSCFGFLWWNASPAAIFMGDTGSLALGGALAGLAILTRTELLLQQAMTALRSDRTSFVIAHRLSTIRDADLILVMEDGAIVEQGTHDSLLLGDGAYARLYNAQFAAAVAGRGWGCWGGG
mgnify:CR=1 FL=1